MSATYAYVLMEQGGVCQGNVGQNMLELAGIEIIYLKTMGEDFFVEEGLVNSYSEWREWGGLLIQATPLPLTITDNDA